MSGGFRGGSHSLRRTQFSPDTPLIKLVEEYLYEFKHLSFINLEHMGEEIRKRCFRYARMKQSTFKEQLRNAYQQYSENAQRNLDEFSGDNIELDNTPLTDDTLREMEGYPSEESGNSDLEVDESQQCNVAKDAGVNQMKALYLPPSSSNLDDEVELSSSKDHKVPDSSKELKEEKVSNEITGRTDKTDCVSISSSTDLSIKAENTKAKSAMSSKEKVSSQVDDDNDSESDLEIIEEVPNERTHNSVITNGYNRPTQFPVTDAQVQSVVQSLASLPQINVFPVKNDAMTTITNSNDGVGSNLVSTEPKTRKKIETPARGIKRKQFATSDNEASGGINDDMTRKKPRKEVAVIHDTGYKLKDFAGSDKVVEEVCKLLMHLKHPEVYQTLGVTPPRGFLLHGPPGTGKTLLANAIAGELQTPMLKIAGTELVSGISGESESNIRELFNQAVTVAPCIIFIDEIDSVTPRRENVNKEMERRIVAQLLSCIDDLVNKEKGNQVLLIGATNRIEAIDTALRRAGRFDREICLGIPDERSREKILSVICRDLKLESGFEIGKLARLTPGYVGADLQALVREAAVQAVNRKLLSNDTENPINSDFDSSVMDVDEEPVDNAEARKPNTTEKEQKGAIVSVPISDESQGQNPTLDETQEVTPTTEETQEVTPTLDEKQKPTPTLVEMQEATPTSDEKQKPTPTSVEKQEPSLAVAEKQVSDPMRWIKEAAPLTAVELQDLFVTLKDFTAALKNVQPSSKREGFATVPDTTWDDIGALQNIRDELQVSILGPVKHAAAFQKLGLTTPAGVLLCGPPGCGKTLLAKAVANEAGINFISVKGPELLNMYVGESERAVRQCFLRARNSSPCVIFFDELDALCPRRSDVADSGSSGRIVNQLLTEMDGIESRQGVYVMAASNRPDIIDPAVLRPGRLDKILFVNLPTPHERFEILKALTKNSSKPILSDDVNLEEIANCPDCEDYTGADLAALIREASIASFRELVLNAESDGAASIELKVHKRHFTVAFTKTKPSVGKDERMKYKLMAERYSSIR